MLKVQFIIVLYRSRGTGIAIVIELFSILALATSFIGTLIGFMAFFKETFNQNCEFKTKQLNVMAEHVKGWMSKRMEIASYVLILAPPLVALSMVSDAFFFATDLAVILRLLIIFKLNFVK